MRLRRSCSVSQSTAGVGCFSTAGMPKLSSDSISSTCADVGLCWGPLLNPSYVSLANLILTGYACRLKEMWAKSGVVAAT